MVINDELPVGGGANAGIVEREDDEPAVILFTSGTSGRPKGAVLTHGSIRAAARNAAEALVLGPDDVVLGAACTCSDSPPGWCRPSSQAPPSPSSRASRRNGRWRP